MADYFDVLAELHETRRPRTYLEIGVFQGDSLKLARADTVRVGVDPEPLLSPADAGGCILETTTSDEFFAGDRPAELFGGLPVDLTFIDGMHLFEYALRDFTNAESLSGPDSLIVLHDCLPRDAATSTRDSRDGFWTGDVWKLVLCLLDHRADLDLFMIDAPPTGLLCARALDRASPVLRSGYDALLEQYGALEFADWQARLPEVRRLMEHPEARLWRVFIESVDLADRLLASEARAGRLETEIQVLRERLVTADADVVSLRGRLAARDKDMARLHARIVETEGRIAEANRRIAESDERTAAAEARAADADRRLWTVASSSSWRITAPLRGVSAVLKRRG
jgi:Methyltransferase domain